MQNPIRKFRQNSIVFEKPGILSEKLKTLTSTNYHRLIYLLKFFIRSLHNNINRGIFVIFLFCLELELFSKIKIDLVSTHSQKPAVAITQDLNKF